MIIAVCGNGYCGSSAVTDYLHENELIAVSPYDIEFMFLYDVDGIDDLRHHIVTRPVRYYSSDAAIKRYRHYIRSINSPGSYLHKIAGNRLINITENYLKEITQVEWHGWWHFDIRNASILARNWNFRIMPRINRLSNRILGKTLDIYPNSRMQISVRPERFDFITQEYVQKLVDIFNPKNLEFVVLDQPFPVGTMSYYKRYFKKPIKTITVVRDPRDVYIAAKCINSTYSSWIPTKNINDFIKYFKLINKNSFAKNESEITVFFEDLIYKYVETTKLIDTFLGINGARSKKYFCPETSINNTQLFKKHLEYNEDIKKIENELEEYLYDYSKINILPKWEKSF